MNEGVSLSAHRSAGMPSGSVILGYALQGSKLLSFVDGAFEFNSRRFRSLSDMFLNMQYQIHFVKHFPCESTQEFGFGGKMYSIIMPS